jgi:ATP-binding cassette subfamily B protein RaxB
MRLIDKLHFGAFNKLPIHLQTESAECSLACLSMIASYHGHIIEVSELRQKYPLTLRGTNLKQVMEIATQLKLSPRALRTEIESFNEITLPAVLHWDFNHFVVLKSTRKNIIIIHDPAQGIRHMTPEEVSKHFTGIVLELQPVSDFEITKGKKKLQIHHLWSSIHGLVSNLAYVFAFALSIQILVLISPYFIRLVVDEIVLAQDHNLLLVAGFAFALLQLIKTLAMGLRSWVVLHIGTVLNVQLVNNLFTHLLKLPLDYFQRRHVGDIVSRFVSIDEIRKLLANGLIESIIDGFMVTTSIIVMYVYNVTLATIALAAVLLYSGLRFILYPIHKRSFEEFIVKNANEETVFLETVRTMQTIKSFANESTRQSLWQNRFIDKSNANIKLGRFDIVYKTTHELVTGLEYIAIVWVGALSILDAQLTVGMLIAFLAYRSYFANLSHSLIDKVFEFRLLRMHLDRISDIVNTKPERYLTSKRSLTEPLTGGLELRRVSFRYSESDDYIFKNVTLRIEPGESVAIVGPSGCGKTTLLKIMMGLIQPTSGKILVDGVNIKHLGLRNYRNATASVMQDDTLMSGSIADNISFFDPQVDQQRIQHCAVAAHIAEDIIKMPMGFQTLVGDLGNTLSGGQQQRLLLARALYRDPRILFLDEASSHLDIDTEKKIVNTLTQIGCTRIMIAHRPESITLASRIIDIRNLSRNEIRTRPASRKMA